MNHPVKRLLLAVPLLIAVGDQVAAQASNSLISDGSQLAQADCEASRRPKLNLVGYSNVKLDLIKTPDTMPGSGLAEHRALPYEDQGDASPESSRRDWASTNSLTLQELQTRALSLHPAIQSAHASLQAARGLAFQAGLKKNPHVGFQFEQLGSNGQAEQYGVTYGQEWVRSEKRIVAKSIAGHEVHRHEQLLAAAERRVLMDVEVAYLRVLRAQRQIDVVRDLVRISQDALSLSQRLFAADEVARTDVLQAELEVAAAQIKLQDSENRHQSAWRTLEAGTGGGALQVQPLQGDLYAVSETLEFEAVLNILKQQSPQIAAQMAQIEQARCQLRLEQLKPRPDPTLQGVMNWRDNGIGGNADAGLAVSIPLPVHDRNAGAIHAARYRLAAAHSELERLELEFRGRLAPVYEQYLNARQRVDALRTDMIPKATETRELTRQTYELGVLPFASLLAVQQTYARLRMDLIEALESLHVAEVEMAGMLLD